MQFFCRGERLFARKGNPPPRPDWLPYFSPSRERSERLDIALSRSNGLGGERVHDLERSTANHVLERSAGSRS